MKISSERFQALLSGTATGVTGQEVLIRLEAFSAERRGEDPSMAVEKNLPHVTIIKRHRVKEPMAPANISLASASTVSAAKDSPADTDARSLFDRIAEGYNRLSWGTFCVLFALVGATVIWIAASSGLGALVAHFFVLCIAGQFLSWFFKRRVQ